MFSFLLLGRGEVVRASLWVQEDLSSYNGATVEKIEISGLNHTSERAVRLLFGLKEGDLFSSELWNTTTQKLYNTAVLYNVQTKIDYVGPQESKKIVLHLSVEERVALVPALALQASLGSTVVDFGVRHLNLGGYFTRAYVGLNSYNGDLGYKIRFFQEWFLDTDYIFEFEVSKLDFPTVQQDQSGVVLNQFTWSRSLQELLVGKRFGNKIRLLLTSQLFEDAMYSGSSSLIFPQLQYRLEPKLILNRVNFGDYLDEGNELSIAPAFSNFFDANFSYSQAVIKYKQVTILPGEATFAYLVDARVMTSAPLPYQFQLGGLERIRGYSANRFFGTSSISTNVEFRPILYSANVPFFKFLGERGLGQVVVQGAGFTDFGWIGSVQNSQYLGMVSMGAGLRIIFVNFARAILRVDVAQTISPNEGLGFSFGLGQFF